MPERVITDLSLTAWDLRTFFVLARLSYRDGRGGLKPVAAQAKKLASDLGVPTEAGRVMVQRAIGHLEQRGLLTITRQKGAMSTLDVNPAWRPTCNSAVTPTCNPGVTPTGNPTVTGSGKTCNPTVTPVGPPRTPPSDSKRGQTTAADAAAAAVGHLLDHGIGEETAADLVSEFGPDSVELQIGYLPDRQAEVPAAVLVESIRGRWPPPRISGRAVPEGPEAHGDGGAVSL